MWGSARKGSRRRNTLRITEVAVWRDGTGGRAGVVRYSERREKGEHVC